MVVAETQDMERILVSSAALKDKLARITLRNVPDRPGVEVSYFRPACPDQDHQFPDGQEDIYLLPASSGL